MWTEAMTMERALHELGVRKELITEAEREHLDREGWVVLEGVLTPGQVEALRSRLDEHSRLEGNKAGIEVHQEEGTDRLADLVNKGSVFEVCFTHPRVLAAVWHVMDKRDFRLSSLNSRAVLPGRGHQNLHADGPPPNESRTLTSVQTSWMIDALTPHNGPTRVVPGSHLLPHGPIGALEDPAAPHPAETYVHGDAGSVCVFPGNMWHSGTMNTSDKPRRVIHGYFGSRSAPQQTDQRTYIRPETYERLSRAARFVIDVEG